MSEVQYDLFLSYQWNIKENVQSLHDYLSSLNYTVIMDDHTFSANSDLSIQITQAVKNSRAVICCITKAYDTSKNCRREISLANDYNKPLIVLMFEDLKITDLEFVGFYITSILRINLFEDPQVTQSWQGPKSDEIIKAINNALGIMDKPIKECV